MIDMGFYNGFARVFVGFWIVMIATRKTVILTAHRDFVWPAIECIGFDGVAST